MRVLSGLFLAAFLASPALAGEVCKGTFADSSGAATSIELLENDKVVYTQPYRRDSKENVVFNVDGGDNVVTIRPTDNPKVVHMTWDSPAYGTYTATLRCPSAGTAQQFVELVPN
jgi:hypothetical protein